MMMTLKKQQGFTLIELIIVIVILGVLAAVGIPRFMNTRLEAWASTCRSNRASLDDAVERYRFDNNDAAVVKLASDTAWQTTLKNGNYIKNEFICPATNTSDSYTVSEAGLVDCKNIDSSPSIASKKHADK